MHSPSIYGLIPQPSLSPRMPLLFMPLIFLLLSLYNLSIQGPFYSFNNIDPSYAYLFNGFELLHFHTPGHVDHPGTTTQILMALVILVKWGFSAMSCWLTGLPVPSLDHLFFTQPDSFLYAGAVTLILINTVLFSLVSYNLYSHSKNLAVLFAFQLGLFLFFPTIETFSMYTPEPMLLTGVLLLCLGLFPVLIKHNLMTNPKYARYFGLAFGFGMATKVTFLPLGLFLFLYPKTQYKKIITYSLIGFLICTFPIWGRYFKMIQWLFNIAFHQGHYGSGSVGLIDNTKIIHNFNYLITTAPFLFISMISISAYLLITFKNNSPIIKKFLILSLGALLFSLVLNLKHPGIRYMIPVLLLCAPLSAVIAYQLRQHKKIYSAGLLSILLAGIGLSAKDYQNWHAGTLLEAKGRASFQEYVKQNQCKVIGYYNPSMQSYAMYFGNQWAWKKRSPMLSQYYPNSIFFDPQTEKFYDFNGPRHHQLNSTEVEIQLKSYACVLFQGYDLNLPPNSQYRAQITPKSLDNNQTIAGKFYEWRLT
jgi:hypothetical protein